MRNLVNARWARRTLAAGPVGVAALAIAGCGGSTSTASSSSHVIVSSTATPVIDKQIEVSGSPAAKSINCPQTAAAVGKTFTCHVTLQDGAAYAMTLRVDQVGSQRPLLTVVHSLLVTVGASNVKPLIDQQLRQLHAPAAKSIDCPNVPATVGNKFICKIALVDGHVATDQFTVLTISATAPPTFQIKGLGVS